MVTGTEPGAPATPQPAVPLQLARELALWPEGWHSGRRADTMARGLAPWPVSWHHGQRAGTMAGRLALQLEGWHYTVPGQRTQGGLFIHILGFFPPKEPPHFLVGCRAGMQWVVPAPGTRGQHRPQHGHTGALPLGKGQSTEQGTPSHPSLFPVFFHSPPFYSILFK